MENGSEATVAARDRAPIACRSCGAATSSPQEFIRVSRGRSAGYTCRSCAEAKARRGAAGTVATGLLLGLCGLWMQARGDGLVQVGPNRQLDVAAMLVFCSLLYLCSFVHVVPHELGHALVGRLVRFRVLRIVVGVGSPVLERRIGATSVEIRSLPVGGLTTGTTSVRGALRTRLWLFAAGGPAATILVTAVAWRFAADAGESGAGAILTAFVFAGVATAVGNLVPHRSAGQSSDGWKLVTTPFMPRATLDRMVEASGNVELVEHLRRGDHDDAVDQARRLVAARPDAVDPRLALTVVLLQAKRWAEAAQEIRAQLAAFELDDEKRALHLNNLAWADLMGGDRSLLDEADRASAEAFALQPWRHAIRGTRGSVLVERGELAEGIELLRSSELSSHAPQSRASTDAYLAIAFAASGNVWDARKRCASARSADPTHQLLPRAFDALAEAELALSIDQPDGGGSGAPSGQPSR